MPGPVRVNHVPGEDPVERNCIEKSAGGISDEPADVGVKRIRHIVYGGICDRCSCRSIWHPAMAAGLCLPYRNRMDDAGHSRARRSSHCMVNCYRSVAENNTQKPDG